MKTILKKESHLHGENIRYEVKVGDIYFRNWYSPHKDSEGKIIGLLGLSVNITKQKNTEDELKKHHEKLEELVKERTKELEEKNIDLEDFNELFIGREFRIKELKDRVNELEEKLNTK